MNTKISIGIIYLVSVLLILSSPAIASIFRPAPSPTYEGDLSEYAIDVINYLTNIFGISLDQLPELPKIDIEDGITESNNQISNEMEKLLDSTDEFVISLFNIYDEFESSWIIVDGLDIVFNIQETLPTELGRIFDVFSIWAIAKDIGDFTSGQTGAKYYHMFWENGYNDGYDDGKKDGLYDREHNLEYNPRNRLFYMRDTPEDDMWRKGYRRGYPVGYDSAYYGN